MSSTQVTPTSDVEQLPSAEGPLPFWATAVLTGGGAVWLALHLRAYAALALSPLGVPGSDPRSQVPGVMEVERLVLGPVGFALAVALVLLGVFLRLRDRKASTALVVAIWLLPVMGAFGNLALASTTSSGIVSTSQLPAVMDLERVALGPAGGLMLAAILITGIIVRMPDQSHTPHSLTGTPPLSRDQETL